MPTSTITSNHSGGSATAPAVETEPMARCPSCREDGSYGDTQPHIDYRCQCCGTDWSWTDGPDSHRPRPWPQHLASWLFRLRIRATSTCSCWRQ